jgi:hypothetical protein
MEVKIFYCCHSSGDEVPSSDPVVFDLESAVDIAHQVLLMPGDFIGFVDSSNRVLQFRFDESEQVWVEHPSPKDAGSFGKFISYPEVETLIKNLPEKLHKTCLPGLEFLSW